MIEKQPCFGSELTVTDDKRRTQKKSAKCGSGRKYSRYASEVLKFFGMHRTALAGHVQRMYPRYFHTDRTVRLHLQTLIEAGDLRKIHHRLVGEPGIYLITSRGLREAGTTLDAGDYQKWQRRQQAGSHLEHELLITEFAVRLAETIHDRNDLTIPYHERWGLAAEPRMQPLLPDFSFVFQHTSGLMVCFVEVSCGEDSPTRLRKKLMTYADWASLSESQEFMAGIYERCGATRPQPEFRLLFVLQNRRTGNDIVRLRQMIDVSLHLEPTLQRRLWFTTATELMQQPHLAGTIWVRGKDFAQLELELAAHRAAARRRLFHRLAAALPHYRLFPDEAVS